MAELSAEPIQFNVQAPTSRFNRTIPYTYAGYSFSSDPDLPVVPENDDDQFYTLAYADMFRPDLVADRFYGDSNLWWFLILVNHAVLQADGKLNFLEMFLPGVTLRVPSQQTAFSYINARS